MLGEEDPEAPGSFASKSRLTRFIVLVAGSVMNVVAAAVLFSVAYMFGVPTPAPDIQGVQIADIVPDSPASQAGLVKKDIVRSMNGTAVSSVQEFRDVTQQNLGTPITLELLRNDASMTVQIVPRVDPPPGQGSMGVAIETPTRRVSHNPITALGLGTVKAGEAFISTPMVMYMVAKAQLPAEVLRPVGPAGIYQITDQAMQRARQTRDPVEVLTIAGVISAGLAFANLLPIPALDGGRILFVLIEAIRGTRISPQKEGIIHFVGIVVLIALMLLIAVNDIANPIVLRP